jgi:hypothetical protein
MNSRFSQVLLATLSLFPQQALELNVFLIQHGMSATTGVGG